MIVAACGGGGGGGGNGGGVTSADGPLQGDWYFNKGNVTYSFDTIKFVSANTGYPEGYFIASSGGTLHNYIYNIDDTGTAVMIFNDLGNGTVQLVRTYSFEVSQSMLKMSCWNMTAYYCKGSANSCLPPADANTYSISGTVTESGTPLQGVTVTLNSTTTATTDASGNYTFTGLANGSYAVTPSKSGYTFSPTSSSRTVNGANIAGVNFAATATTAPTYSISGTVIASGSALQGVTMTLSGTSSRSVNTDASGNYTFTGLANGNYTVTPSKSGYTFSPTSSSLTVYGANIPGVNFIESSATGATAYAYTGNPFTSCNGTYCTGGPYALSLSFVTTLAGSALVNLPYTDISSTIKSFSVTDGTGLVITEKTVGAYAGISISTDASGNIVGWLAGGYANNSNVQMQTNFNSPYGFVVGSDFSETTASFAGDWGQNFAQPGIWTVTPNP
jgi:hypothetical protein